MIRGAEGYGAGFGESVIQRRAGGGAGKNANLEITAGGVHFLGSLGYGERNGLSGPAGVKLLKPTV